jgi:hypothetical protein
MEMASSRIMRWVRHVESIGEMRNGDISVGRYEESCEHGWSKL